MNYPIDDVEQVIEATEGFPPSTRSRLIAKPARGFTSTTPHAGWARLHSAVCSPRHVLREFGTSSTPLSWRNVTYSAARYRHRLQQAVPLPRVPCRHPTADVTLLEPVFAGQTSKSENEVRCPGTSLSSFIFSARHMLIDLAFGEPLIMNEHVDWAAMSDEEFIALVRQLLEVPAGWIRRGLTPLSWFVVGSFPVASIETFPIETRAPVRVARLSLRPAIPVGGQTGGTGILHRAGSETLDNHQAS